MSTITSASPILSCQKASELEAKLLEGSAAEWSAMKQAGRGIALSVAKDYQEIRPVPEGLHVLGLIGKGHNGGDALLACTELLAEYPRARVSLIVLVGKDALKSLTYQAYKEIEGRAEIRHLDDAAETAEVEAVFRELTGDTDVDICLDGLFGMSFTPPVGGVAASLIRIVNASNAILLRASVDLPSGVSDATEAAHAEALQDEDIEEPLTFHADFCYATGVVKAPVIRGKYECGRVRLIDLGFFPKDASVEEENGVYLLGDSVLKERKKLRPASVDKRTYGHLFIVAGSRQMPGAMLMAARAAVQSGVGRVTAFAPSSVAASFAAELPEVMWFPMPESPNGFLSMRGLPYLFDRLPSASAILVGPGMGLDRQTDSFVIEVLTKIAVPVVLDADALSQKVMEFVGKRRRAGPPFITTPHLGEFRRMAKRLPSDFTDEDFRQFCAACQITTVLKGAKTRISDGGHIYYSSVGGPILARGGSGDILAGLISGFLAQSADDPCKVAAQGVLLHGLAAEAMARVSGQHFVRTCDILDHLVPVMRS